MAVKISDVLPEFTVPALDILEYAKREGNRISIKTVEGECGGLVFPLIRAEVSYGAEGWKCRLTGYYGVAQAEPMYEFEILGCVFRTSAYEQSDFSTHGKDVAYGSIDPAWFWRCLRKYIPMVRLDSLADIAISENDYSDDDIIDELKDWDQGFDVYALDEDLDVCAFETLETFEEAQAECRGEGKCGYSRISDDMAFKLLAHRRPKFELFFNE